MTIHALIVDDEAPARDELAFLLQDHPDVSARMVAGAREALDIIRDNRPDVVFQDIQMPGLDGFHVLAEASAQSLPPLFVFVTAYDQHAIRAFEENAVDYLLKPVSPDRLAKSLDRVRRLLGTGQDRPASGTGQARVSGAVPPGSVSEGAPGEFPVGQAGQTGRDHDGGTSQESSGTPGVSRGGGWLEDPEAREAVERLLRSAGRSRTLPRLAVEQGGRICLVPTSRVVLIEAEDKRVTALTDSGRFACHGLATLARACERLEGLPFFQANRAQLINLERIAEFSPWFGGKYHVVLTDPDRTEITVSRNRAREFKSRLGL